MNQSGYMNMPPKTTDSSRAATEQNCQSRFSVARPAFPALSLMEDPSSGYNRKDCESPLTECLPEVVASTAFSIAPKAATTVNPLSLPLVPVLQSGAASAMGAGAAALWTNDQHDSTSIEEGSKSKNTSTTRPNSSGSSSNNKKRSKPLQPSQPQPPLVTMATISLSASAAFTSMTGTSGENTGRWTAEEHRLFLQGLDEHGKGWKKIAALIKSRTVVQIRTHAQKYFQKLAKARQNGEDGVDSMMDCRSLSMEEHLTSSSSNFKKQKRGELLLNGTTKRKSIASIVASVVREQAITQDQQHQGGDSSLTKERKVAAVSHLVAPALMPFIPAFDVEQNPTADHDAHQMQGFLSSAVLEESLYRFLTPFVTENSVVTPSSSGDESVGGVLYPPPYSTSVDPIKVPAATAVHAAGETSPTGVNDICFASLWKESTVPHWYSTGADVEELLDDADALDWLSDSGDLDETYGHILSSSSKLGSTKTPETHGASTDGTVDAAAVETYPAAVLGSMTAENASMSLPCLFDHALNHHLHPLGGNKRLKLSVSCFASATEAMEASSLPIVPSSCNMIVGDEHFTAFDGACFDEQAFVTALLESSGGDSSTLS